VYEALRHAISAARPPADAGAWRPVALQAPATAESVLRALERLPP
jgi:xanthine dehydrogenase molybdopterin-binding subunit B